MGMTMPIAKEQRKINTANKGKTGKPLKGYAHYAPSDSDDLDDADHEYMKLRWKQQAEEGQRPKHVKVDRDHLDTMKQGRKDANGRKVDMSHLGAGKKYGE